MRCSTRERRHSEQRPLPERSLARSLCLSPFYPGGTGPPKRATRVMHRATFLVSSLLGRFEMFSDPPLPFVGLDPQIPCTLLRGLSSVRAHGSTDFGVLRKHD